MQRILRGIARSIRHRADWVRSIVNLILVGSLALTLLTVWVPATIGELPILKIWEQQFKQPDRSVVRLGNLEVTPVHFEGRELFTVVSPTVWDRSQSGSQIPVEARAAQIESNLQRVVDGSFIPGRKDGILTNFDPKTLQVGIISLNDVPVIVASDSYHAQPLNLITVTYLDADYNGQPIALLSEQWRSVIYQNLYVALMDRSPEALSLRGKLGESLVTIGLMLAASALLWMLQMPLKRRNRQLRLQQAEITAQMLPDQAELEASHQTSAGEYSALQQMQERFFYGFQQQMQQQQQRDLLGFLRWLLAWGQVAVWVLGLAAALLIFPWTKQFAWQLLGTPTVLLLIWFLTSVCNRMMGALLHGAGEAWVKFGSSAMNAPQRDAFRIFTLLTALKPVKTSVVYVLGIGVTLVYLGLPSSLLLTLATILALASLLVFHRFVRDWLAGCLMLWEDQYTIGDVVSIDYHAGLVERMNLRLTQLRTLEGELISIANGTITFVENLTQHWQALTRREADSRKGQQGTYQDLKNREASSLIGSEASESPVES